MLIILFFYIVCLLTPATADLSFSHYMEWERNMGRSIRPSRELELTFTTNNNALLVPDGGFCLRVLARSFFPLELFFIWPWIKFFFKKLQCHIYSMMWIHILYYLVKPYWNYLDDACFNIYLMFFIDGSQTCRQHPRTDQTAFDYTRLNHL